MTNPTQTQERNQNNSSILSEYLPNPGINFFREKSNHFSPHTGYQFRTPGVFAIIENFTRTRPKEHVILISSQYVASNKHFFGEVVSQASKMFSGVTFEFYVINELNSRRMIIVPIPGGN